MVEELKTSVLDQTVSGALLDSYVAGYWARIAPNSVLKDSNLRVGTVLDHQFAYGFVIAGALQNEVTERCMRKKLNSMETDITAIIQEKAKTMEVKKIPTSRRTSPSRMGLSFVLERDNRTHRGLQNIDFTNKYQRSVITRNTSQLRLFFFSMAPRPCHHQLSLFQC